MCGNVTSPLTLPRSHRFRTDPPQRYDRTKFRNGGKKASPAAQASQASPEVRKAEREGGQTTLHHPGPDRNTPGARTTQNQHTNTCTEGLGGGEIQETGPSTTQHLWRTVGGGGGFKPCVRSGLQKRQPPTQLFEASH